MVLRAPNAVPAMRLCFEHSRHVTHRLHPTFQAGNLEVKTSSATCAHRSRQQLFCARFVTFQKLHFGV
eukprot:3083542-Amphidinium_carterae.1